MKKQYALMKITNILQTINQHTAEADHIRYIHSQLRHDHISPAQAMEQVRKLLQ